MKKIITLTLGVTAFVAVLAQPGRPGKPGPGVQRLEAMHVAFLTRELALTPEEAQQFWPVYEKYKKELKASFNSNAGQQDPLDRQQKMLDIRKKYRDEFAKSLGKERANKVFNYEDHFRTMVKHAAEKRRKNGYQQRPPQRPQPRKNWAPQE
jgi:hypothetical protein